MTGDPYRARGPSKHADAARLRPRPELTRATRLVGVALLLDSAWLLAFAQSLSGASLAGAPYLASGLTFLAAWSGLASLRGRGVVYRRAALWLVAADFAWLWVGLPLPESDFLIVHLYLASARVMTALVSITVGWHARRRRWWWPCSALAAVTFTVLFARSWLGYAGLWPMDHGAHAFVHLLIAGTLGLCGVVALVAPERDRIASEEMWLRRAALPAREIARLIVHPDGRARLVTPGDVDQSFRGLGDALDWLRDNDYVEDDGPRAGLSTRDGEV